MPKARLAVMALLLLILAQAMAVDGIVATGLPKELPYQMTASVEPGLISLDLRINGSVAGMLVDEAGRAVMTLRRVLDPFTGSNSTVMVSYERVYIKYFYTSMPTGSYALTMHLANGTGYVDESVTGFGGEVLQRVQANITLLERMGHYARYRIISYIKGVYPKPFNATALDVLEVLGPRLSKLFRARLYSGISHILEMPLYDQLTGRGWFPTLLRYAWDQEGGLHATLEVWHNNTYVPMVLRYDFRAVLRQLAGPLAINGSTYYLNEYILVEEGSYVLSPSYLDFLSWAYSEWRDVAVEAASLGPRELSEGQRLALVVNENSLYTSTLRAFYPVSQALVDPFLWLTLIDLVQLGKARVVKILVEQGIVDGGRGAGGTLRKYDEVYRIHVEIRTTDYTVKSTLETLYDILLSIGGLRLAEREEAIASALNASREVMVLRIHTGDPFTRGVSSWSVVAWGDISIDEYYNLSLIKVKAPDQASRAACIEYIGEKGEGSGLRGGYCELRVPGFTGALQVISDYIDVIRSINLQVRISEPPATVTHTITRTPYSSTIAETTTGTITQASKVSVEGEGKGYRIWNILAALLVLATTLTALFYATRKGPHYMPRG